MIFVKFPFLIGPFFLLEPEQEMQLPLATTEPHTGSAGGSQQADVRVIWKIQ